MAEVLRIVGSGIALAQLAGMVLKSTQKIRTFWKEIQGAPKKVVGLLEEIEALTTILRDIHGDDQYGCARVSIAKALLNLVLRNLEDVVRALNAGMGDIDRRGKGARKRRWTKIKTACKKNAMEDSMRVLERAKSTLLTAIVADGE